LPERGSKIYTNKNFQGDLEFPGEFPRLCLEETRTASIQPIDLNLSATYEKDNKAIGNTLQINNTGTDLFY